MMEFCVCVCVCVRGGGQLAKETICGLEKAWTPSAHSAHYPASLVFTAIGQSSELLCVYTARPHTHTHAHAPLHTKANTCLRLNAKNLRFYSKSAMVSVFFHLKEEQKHLKFLNCKNCSNTGRSLKSAKPWFKFGTTNWCIKAMNLDRHFR